MVDEKPNHYDTTESLSIPSYDEAITSRPSSSQSFLGPSEVSHDAERQGLLSHTILQHGSYHAPTVESVRSSLDLLSSSGEISPRATEDLGRAMMEMEVQEPETTQRYRFSKHLTTLTHSLSSFNIPFRQWLPSRDYISAKIPSLNWVMFGRVFGLLLLISLAYLLFFSDLFTVDRRQGARVFYAESVKDYVRDRANAMNIRNNAIYLTSYDHMAGTKGNYILGEWVQELFKQGGLEDVRMEQFDVYLNYPKVGGRRVAILEPPEVAWEALIEEEAAYHDPPREQTPVFHGYSKSGTVTGRLIYANYGSKADINRLQSQGINITESILLVRYYGTQHDRAMKVKAAEMAGAVGCIIYSDPAEDGFLRGDPYPVGRYMPSDGVQRGSVAMTPWIVGDVATSGFASLPEEIRRDSIESNPGLPSIPSIPLAWRDAQKLLRALQGHGIKLGDDWGKGGVPDVEWWTGDLNSPIIQLMNEQDEVERRPIYNILGRIAGKEQPEKAIIVGNHRDAWCKGAADPSTATAVLLEVVRTFGDLRKEGWEPLRTIEFASWDGEEYNLIGSTEHVEARIDEIRRNGFVYLNVDVAVTGTNFEASASPVLETALLRTLERVIDPTVNKTLRAVWAEKGSSLRGLGAGSDYVAFQDLAGTSSLDMGFSGAPFPYHSCYDTFEWMDTFGDPGGFQYHKMLAQIWALLILEFADRELLPFDFKVYARAVGTYVDDLENYVQAQGVVEGQTLDLTALHEAARELSENADRFHAFDKDWEEAVGNGGFESNIMAIKRISHNTRMANFETNLLGDGLKGREQYVHALFAPQAWNTYECAFIPSVRDAIDEGDWQGAQEEVGKVAGVLSYASRKLNN